MTASLPTIEPALPKSRVVVDPRPRALPRKSLHGVGLRAGDLIMADTERELMHRIMGSHHVPKVCESPTAILDRARKELAEKTDAILDPAELPPCSPGVSSADLEEEASVVTNVIVDPSISDPATVPSSPEPPQAPRANTYDTFHPFRHRASARNRHLELAEWYAHFPSSPRYHPTNLPPQRLSRRF